MALPSHKMGQKNPLNEQAAKLFRVRRTVFYEKLVRITSLRKCVAPIISTLRGKNESRSRRYRVYPNSKADVLPIKHNIYVRIPFNRNKIGHRLSLYERNTIRHNILDSSINLIKSSCGSEIRKFD